MEGKDGIKMETWSFSDQVFPFLPPTPASGGAENMSSLGFMELLGFQDLFDYSNLHLPSLQPLPETVAAAPSPMSETVVNTPATPNSSSISSASASSEAVNDDHTAKTADQEQEDEGDLDKTKKLLKPKKTNQKKQKEPRFAFMTKSEVDHLEDGYRWRKYGQKAVKNSTFPRSYYRCTSAACNVKKRVERSFNDPSTVVTTYEGQHIHPSPLMPRSVLAGAPSPFSATAAGNNFALSMPLQNLQYNQQQQPNLSPFSFSPSTALLGDYGLLQDLVPSHTLNE